MQLSTPHRQDLVEATPQAIVDVIAELPGKEYPFVILGGSDQLRFIQTWPGTVTVAGKPSLDVLPGTDAILKQAGLKRAGSGE